MSSEVSIKLTDAYVDKIISLLSVLPLYKRVPEHFLFSDEYGYGYYFRSDKATDIECSLVFMTYGTVEFPSLFDPIKRFFGKKDTKKDSGERVTEVFFFSFGKKDVVFKVKEEVHIARLTEALLKRYSEQKVSLLIETEKEVSESMTSIYHTLSKR